MINNCPLQTWFTTAANNGSLNARAISGFDAIVPKTNTNTWNMNDDDGDDDDIAAESNSGLLDSDASFDLTGHITNRQAVLQMPLRQSQRATPAWIIITN